MGRVIGGLVAGLFVGMVVMIAIEALGMYLIPPPAGVESEDPKVAAQAMRNLSAGSFVFVLVAWFVGTFSAAVVATWIGGRGDMWPALVLGGVFELCGLAMLFMIPSPWWFTVIGVALFFPAAFAGHMLGNPKR